MIKIALEKLLTNFQDFIKKENYFFYDIIKKNQVLDKQFMKEHFLPLNELIRKETLSNFYDDKSFIVENEKEVDKVKLFFIQVLDAYLEMSNIDISNIELVQNNDVNINARDLQVKWLNIDKNKFRKEILERYF